MSSQHPGQSCCHLLSRAPSPAYVLWGRVGRTCVTPPPPSSRLTSISTNGARVRRHRVGHPSAVRSPFRPRAGLEAVGSVETPWQQAVGFHSARTLDDGRGGVARWGGGVSGSWSTPQCGWPLGFMFERQSRAEECVVLGSGGEFHRAPKCHFTVIFKSKLRLRSTTGSETTGTRLLETTGD